VASGAFERLRLLKRAQKDLDRIAPSERARLVDDLVRLANRTFPGEVKKISSLPGQPLQADSGRFRILPLWQGHVLWVLAIFARPQQPDVFRGFRRNPPIAP
jgi:hypothetical protein